MGYLSRVRQELASEYGARGYVVLKTGKVIPVQMLHGHQEAMQRATKMETYDEFFESGGLYCASYSDGEKDILAISMTTRFVSAKAIRGMIDTINEHHKRDIFAIIDYSEGDEDYLATDVTGAKAVMVLRKFGKG